MNINNLRQIDITDIKKADAFDPALKEEGEKIIEKMEAIDPNDPNAFYELNALQQEYHNYIPPEGNFGTLSGQPFDQKI